MIVAGWLVESIKQRKLIFRRTVLDLPLIIYLSIYLLSSIFSIDPRTSVLGYYSRFNGGLITQLCYAFLYWTFVSNLNKKQALSSIYYILSSTAIASILAILEHFGVFSTCAVIIYGNIHQPENKNILNEFISLSFQDKFSYLFTKNCWVQDVQTRVFSTLGQPNWLAALLVALIPITWRKSLKYYLLSILFFITLLFTKSRSGFLAFGIEVIIFWGFIYWKDRFKYIKEFLILLSVFISLFLIISMPVVNHQPQITTTQGPSLETGGTESGVIRKYVWLGAIKVFVHYPILGTGPETFAFSYPMFKPVGHNLTSEWDFIYNKAHNEFLNYLANTGILGFGAYLFLIVTTIIVLFKSNSFGLLSGFVAILITNFFGFSVVPISLLSFLFPAIALVQSTNHNIHLNKTRLNIFQKTSILLIMLSLSFTLYAIYNYWSADTHYNKAKGLNRSNQSDQAIIEIEKAVSAFPNESLYLYELALADTKVETANKAFKLTPFNQNVRKMLINNLIKNADTDPTNLIVAESVLRNGIKLSPNDPKLYYQLGLLQLKLVKNDEAVVNLQKSVELKPNYKEGRFVLGMTYKSLNKFKEAKEEFEYLLKNIDPNDELTKKNLGELK